MILSRRIAPLLLLTALLFTGCGDGATETRPLADPPIIVIGVDTFRGDHLGVAGMDGISTPNIDALAGDGVYFTRCQATSPWTGPSFASIFTGLLPYRHGFIGGQWAGLDSSLTTVGEILQKEGYRTGGFVAVKWLTDKFGMRQGLKEHKAFYMGRNGHEAREATTMGQRFVGRYAKHPFFLFLHYYDAHAPYEPVGRFDRMYYEGDEKAPGEPILDTVLSDKNLLPAEKRESGMYDWLVGVTDWDFPVKQYAGGISFVDDHVGRVIENLKKRDIYDETLIVLVGDHGEHLTEHDLYFTHAMPYEEALHVPLVIKWPHGEFAGTRVDARVSIVDVLPTLLGAMGRQIPGGLDGVDLIDLARRPRAESDRALVAEHGTRKRFHKTLTRGDWKLFLTAEEGEIRRRLFNLKDDPGETVDLAGEHPGRVEELTRLLWEICDGEDRLVDRPPVGTDKVDDKTREQLRSLGYIH